MTRSASGLEQPFDEKENLKARLFSVAEKLEALSEKANILRNHFYNHAFDDGTF